MRFVFEPWKGWFAMATHVMRRATATVAVVLLAGCAAGLNEQIRTAGAEGVVAGFWRGLWHGAIAPITFVVSLFSKGVSIYEVHNNGGWYNFGFLLGIHAVWGGHAATRSRKRRKNVSLRVTADG